ncbi:MAG: hypothetical protein M1818_005032 [Claussenomyces sp. TS43310]|nr:MAG: hypothetical protein M1818_005032 [Claussenomyces sp. TS43310]
MSTSEAAFCFPIKRLENSRMILVPFDFSSHAELFVQGTKETPELFSYVSQGPFSTAADFEAFYESRILSTSTETLFAILAKPDASNQGGRFAGIIGLQNASPNNASIEIGFITVLPAFQRTFVTSNAVGLLLLYTLDLPPAGLGLRRCQWQSHADNEASKRVATRMQFTFEGVQRFQRVVPATKVGNGFDTSHWPAVMGRSLGPSRDSAVFAHYCDEWPERRKIVVAILERR